MIDVKIEKDKEKRIIVTGDSRTIAMEFYCLMDNLINNGLDVNEILPGLVLAINDEFPGDKLGEVIDSFIESIKKEKK